MPYLEKSRRQFFYDVRVNSVILASPSSAPCGSKDKAEVEGETGGLCKQDLEVLWWEVCQIWTHCSHGLGRLIGVRKKKAKCGFELKGLAPPRLYWCYRGRKIGWNKGCSIIKKK